MQIKINFQEAKEETELKRLLESKNDPNSKRLMRFLNMPDLSRQAGSPIAKLVEKILKIPRFSLFDDIEVREIVPADISFNLFNFPKSHPVRSKSDTYFLDLDDDSSIVKENYPISNERPWDTDAYYFEFRNTLYILRTHTTIMWYYWLKEESVKEKIKNKESVGAWSYGKVYRKDEIDRNHMNVFHQIDGWYVAPKSQKIIGLEDLKEVLVEIVQAIYGAGIEYRFNKDEFPYTDPSIEMEIKIGDRWIEVLGSGVVRPVVLKNLGVNPDEYNGWAFGSGLERLAILSMDLPDIRLLWSEDERVKKQLKLGQKFVPVSKYPAITRDISFIVGKDFIPNNYFDLIRDLGGNLVEEVQLIDKYEDAAKFGQDRISCTYRIIYRSNERTLVSSEIDKIQGEIYKETAKQFNAELR